MTSGHVMIGLFAGYLLILNALTYGAVYFDKRQAKADGRRISKSKLRTLALLGGSVGAIRAQHKFRHKTKKQPFKSQLYAIATFQIIGIVIWTIPALRTEMMALVR